MHAVMQYLDFARPADEQSVREQVMQLRERRQLTPEQAAAIDVHEIAQFLRSPAGAAHPTGGNALQGIPICASRPRRRSMTPRSMSGEQMMLQGVVDCCFDTRRAL